MAIGRIDNVSMSFGASPLLDRVTLQIEEGERIGLLGRNGSGKSTLMKLLNREVAPDAGAVVFSGNVRTAILPQDVPRNLTGTVYEVVASGGREDTALLREYHDLSSRIGRDRSESLLKRLTEVQQRIEAADSWRFHQRVEGEIARAEVDGDLEFADLSAGLKRRVFLARALVNDPDLLLLDEPTNHLDIESIIRLEDFLLRYEKTLLFVTHDRAFLQRLATRIVEIDRGRLFSFACPYRTYLEKRQALLDAEEKQAEEFDRKLAREEVWIRKGIRARRTRNEGRVRALLEMRRERAARQEQTDVSRFAIAEAERSGRIVAKAKKISFSWGDRQIVHSFSTVLMRGDRVGIIGPNGSGKTTLLKLLLGELTPAEGEVRLGSGLETAYFDQLRAALDETKTVKENVADGADTVGTGQGSRHVVGYLQDFLFTPSRIMSPVSSLSGGERNRLLLAKLFAQPSNVLVLDEPTNDLDAETLDLLEERLIDYRGTVLLVSHDREFLNNVVTSTIVFEGGGRVEEYVGGYDDWLRQRKDPAPGTTIPRTEPQEKRGPRVKQKLSYHENRELEALPRKIEGLEEEKERLTAAINSPDFYKDRDLEKVRAANERLKDLTEELDAAYDRWGELENLARRLSGGAPE